MISNLGENLGEVLRENTAVEFKKTEKKTDELRSTNSSI
jgi:hypothetical protein